MSANNPKMNRQNPRAQRPESSASTGDGTQNSMEYWDYYVELECLRGPEDLQLAAELGKTLLERNKELESSLKHQQLVIEDQSQEIEYLTKQTTALREVNDSRLRIYEQLEVSIGDLERTNQRLALENSSEKKKIKSLCVSIDSLESKCEELQRTLDDMRSAERQRRRRERRRVASIAHSLNSESEQSPPSKQQQPKTLSLENGVYQYYDETDLRPDLFSDNERNISPVPTEICESRIPSSAESDDFSITTPEDEEVIQLREQVRDLKLHRGRDQRGKEDLEFQLAAVIQENTLLQQQVAQLQQKEELVRTLEEELLALEEVRQGRLCGRCLRSSLSPTLDSPDEDGGEERTSLDSGQGGARRGSQDSLLYDGQSPVGLATHSGCTDRDLDRQYRRLINKYEALIRIQGGSPPRHNHLNNLALPLEDKDTPNCLSLQEELEMSGDFRLVLDDEVSSNKSEREDLPISPSPSPSSLSVRSTNKCDSLEQDKITSTNLIVSPKRKSKRSEEMFSETETSSSGFSDGDGHFCNRCTQTEDLALSEDPCSREMSTEASQEHSENCLEANNPVNSHFQKKPEYRNLFQEIFAVLKRSVDENEENKRGMLKSDFEENAKNERLNYNEAVVLKDNKNIKNTEALTKKDDTKNNETEINHESAKNTQSDVLIISSVEQNIKVYKSVGDKSNKVATDVEKHGKKKTNRKGNTNVKINQLETKSPANVKQNSNNTLTKFEAQVCVREHVQRVQQWNFNSAVPGGIGTSAAAADVARLKQLEKSYAEVLRKGLEKGAGFRQMTTQKKVQKKPTKKSAYTILDYWM